MSRKKESSGVQATVERLTGKNPCPEHLRASAYKYLASPLFSTGPRDNRSRPAKLAAPGAHTLLMNALALDEVFGRTTEKVVQVINNELPKAELEAELAAAEREIVQRFEVYSYWKRHIRTLKSVLLDHPIDLKAERLDERLKAFPSVSPGVAPPPFALRAVQELERIEERGRVGRPTANEYAEQADAYMALGDYAKAGEKAREAIDVDSTHARAWFIRVMAALKQRNAAISAMQRHRLTAVEMAEPMSSEEAWAYEMADEAADNAARHHEKLGDILPKALLHWPRANGWQFDHPDQRTIVRNLFIDQVFWSVARGTRDTDERSTFEINGLGPEWDLKYVGQEGIAQFLMANSNQGRPLPLSADERSVLTFLVAERDKHRHRFYDPFDPAFIARDFKLLHLRWVLQLGGYKEHWEDWSRLIADCIPSSFEREILHDDYLFQLWEVHQAQNGGTASVLAVLERWQNRTRHRADDQVNHMLLRSYVRLFHYQYARQDFGGSQETARLAQTITGSTNTLGGSVDLPNAELIRVPAQNTLYWKYLEALSTISLGSAGTRLDESGLALLLDAEKLSTAFQEVQWCFWIEAEFYEGGGGEEYEVEPYAADLRPTDLWLRAIDAQLAFCPNIPQGEALKAVAVALRQLA